jgi:hypothetical protein
MYILFQCRRGHGGQDFRDSRGSSERDLLDNFALAHLLADFLNVLVRCDDVDDTVGNACAVRQLHTGISTRVILKYK